jgi:hypothetical protein
MDDAKYKTAEHYKTKLQKYKNRSKSYYRNKYESLTFIIADDDLYLTRETQDDKIVCNAILSRNTSILIVSIDQKDASWNDEPWLGKFYLLIETEDDVRQYGRMVKTYTDASQTLFIIRLNQDEVDTLSDQICHTSDDESDQPY